MADTIDSTGLPLVNSNTNQVEPVPYDTAQQALLSGTHNLQAGQSVNVINPDGQLVSLPAEQVSEALQSGYNIPTQAHITEFNNQQKYGEGISNELKAGAAGAARIGTFGLSDVALTKSGLVSPETLKQLEERNPLSTAAGEIAGIGASLALPVVSPVGAAAEVGLGVTDAAAPVAAKIAASLANPETSPIVAKILAGVGKAGAVGLGSAVEGAAYGLGNQISETALGDADLNAENLMHNIGYGALFGGALGTTLGIAGSAYDGIFAKEAEKAAAKDAIIANAATAPSNPVPTSLEQIQKMVTDSGIGEVATELPAKARLLETNDVLAGDSQFPTHNLQIQSLDSPALRDGYKSILEDPTNKIGQDLRAYESAQKYEGANKLLPRYIQEIAPKETIIEDAVKGGEKAVKSFTDQYDAEKKALKPLFDQVDSVKLNVIEPEALISKLNEAIPEASQYIIKTPDLWAISKYKPTMPFSKNTYEAVRDLINSLNEKSVTIGDLRNLRNTMGDRVNWLSAPRDSAQISGLRKSLMDYMQDEVQKAIPDAEVREGFKRYAINEQNRETMERIFGGSVSDKATFAKEIKSEDVLERIFSNTASIKAAKDILGPDFDKITANYLAQRVAKVTDPAKNGFSSNKFGTFLKTKAPELEEALSLHPDQLNKIRAINDKMRILPDSPQINPSGTAKTTLLQKMQQVSGYLTPKGLTEIPSQILKGISSKFEQAKQLSEFDRILRGSQEDSATQLANKTKVYGAYSKIERMQQATARKMSKGVDALFEGTEAVKGLAAKQLIPKQEQQEKHDKLQNHLNEMVNNPEKLMDILDKTTQQLHNIAPNIAASLNMNTVRATQFLASKLPNPGQSSPLTPPYKPSSSELAKFNRYATIVDNPLHVLEQMRTGNLTSESLEAMHTVYPKMTAMLQNAILAKLDEKSVSQMSQKAKIMVSAFLGKDLTNSLSQPNIASAQISSQPLPQPAQPQTVRPSQKGLGKLNKGNQALTPQQAALQRTER